MNILLGIMWSLSVIGASTLMAYHGVITSDTHIILVIIGLTGQLIIQLER